MAQKTSFFNRGLSRSWLKRCWPLWTTYLAAWLIALPQSVPELRRYSDMLSYTVNVNTNVVRLGQNMAEMSIFAGIIAAMLMYSYMYSSRSCGMMNALPVRRETVFTTAFITGLVPFIVADVIVIAAAWAVYARTGVVETKNIFLALGFAVMGNIAFYGFATFCAVLTGSLVVLPAVYLVLGCAAAVVELGVQSVLGSLIYGFSAGRSYGTVLSPIIAVIDNVSVAQETVYTMEGRYELTGELIVNGTALMAAYCAAGLILAVCALFIYRRRDMERAGDVVAIPVLKPIFKYCMTFGCAIVLAISPELFGSDYTVRSAAATALVVLAMLLGGAFVGYFVSEMLMQKTLSVFRGKWRGFVVSCAIIIVLTLGAEMDVTGYERRTLDPADVESVSFTYYGTDEKIRQPENIAGIVAFHEEVIAQKDINESAEDTQWLSIEYTLRSGKEMKRVYNIADDAENRADPDSNVRRLAAVLNTQEAVDYRIDFTHGRAVTPADVDYAVISGGYMDEDGEWKNVSAELTADEAARFYNECVVPDSKDSHMGYMWTVLDEEYFDTESYLGFDLQLRMVRGSIYDFSGLDNTYIIIPIDAARCTAWIEENTDLTLMTLRESDPTSAEEQLARTVPTTETAIGVIGGADGPTAIFVK